MPKTTWIRRSIPGHLFEIIDTEGNPILRIRGGMMPALEDARLIETAPELLNVLEAIIFQVLQGSILERDAIVKRAQEVYRKAKGITL